MLTPDGRLPASDRSLQAFADMDEIWRFYRDLDYGRRWQRLSADRALRSESRSGHAEYEGCLANAREAGYVFLPSQDKLARISTR